MQEEFSDLLVAEKFASYPQPLRQQLLKIRQLIFQLAAEDNLGDVNESLKWGQPAYVTPKGSTVRLDAVKDTEGQYAVYFTCNSRLVETFREVYPQSFTYIGNRELRFSLDQIPDYTVLKHCLAMALNYQRVKHLPLLGA